MSAHFHFPTGWGAYMLADGRARFRLWAPSARRLELRLEGRGRLAMNRGGDGWFSLELDGAEAGLAYAFVLEDGREVPDPAARAQKTDVHGPSLLVDPSSYAWRTGDWSGRPWHEAVISELHVGTFAPEGTFDGVARRLDHFVETGITAIELMPIAQFSGERGWGYDGVLPYCPHRAYGGVDGLKRLVDAAHERGLMVLLDVVYNHFGPDGNYIASYAPGFFNEARHTPWGPAIHFDDPAVRAFFIDNPLYWLEEYRLDGLRFDAIDQIDDPSPKHVLVEMAERVRARFPDRRVHLTTEDERNIVSLHPYDREGRPRLHTAEWNDDFHHAAHCIATGEDTGYYAAFNDDPVGHLIRVLAEGFAYQGEPYAPWDGKPRGENSSAQPPTAFVVFNQNHDQIGNRAFGERLTALSDHQTLMLLTRIMLLGPQVPLLFMGEEWGERRPFLYFTDFHGELATAVREGRQREFASFAAFADAAVAETIPDPNLRETFDACRLDWRAAAGDEERAWLALTRELLAVRRTHIVPLLVPAAPLDADSHRLAGAAFAITWRLAGGAMLHMWANFAGEEVACPELPVSAAIIHESAPAASRPLASGRLAGTCVIVATQTGGARDG